MAFNGSANFPPGSVVDFFQSLGLRFGMHQNAFTSFDQTTYQLALPDNSIEKFDKALLFFADVSGRLLLDPKEIDEEREVILQEKTARKSPQQRTGEAVLKRMIPGSIIGERLPIGTDETIMGVQRPDFVDYYSTWYKPSNMTLIIVADADPQAIIAKIPTYFSKGEKTPKPTDLDANVSPSVGLRGSVITDAELTDASIAFVRIAPPDRPSIAMMAEAAKQAQAAGKTREDIAAWWAATGRTSATGTHDDLAAFRKWFAPMVQP
jgi:zinc protease